MGGQYRSVKTRRKYANSYYHRNRILAARKPEVFRNWYLQHHYGIDSSDYDALLKSQHGACAVCRRKDNGGKEYFAVDHCHKTGVVRGLLCTGCNLALGHSGDDPGILRLLADYLEKF